MEKVIVKNKQREVIFDTEKRIYTKTVNPKIKEKLKIFFGLKKPQGRNAAYISKLLNDNGIKTYEVLSFTKYSYVTKEVLGKTLREKILENKDNSEKIEKYLMEYFKIINKILNLNLCYTDFNFNNLMINENNEMIFIDIDEMQDTLYCRIFKHKEVEKRLKKNLIGELNSLKKSGAAIATEKIWEMFKKINPQVKEY